MAIGIIIAVVLVLAIYVVSTYNRFVTLKNQSEEAISQIDAHLKKRFDLIPNLVETVKGYAAHESGTLEAVTKARAAWRNAKTFQEKDRASGEFSKTLKTLFAVSEAYPELKADTGFNKLHDELERIEDGLLQARRYYNAVVKTFNTAISVFPGSLIASIFGGKFPKLEYLSIEEEARENVKVKF